MIENEDFRNILLRDRPNLTLPTRKSLATGLLNLAFEREMRVVVSALPSQLYLSIVSDGWTNTNSEGIVNFVVCVPVLRSLFWPSISLEDKVHSGDHMAEFILSVIDEIEEFVAFGRICSIVTDNASNMKKMWTVIQAKNPTMICNGCASHTVNLLLKDIFEIDLFKAVLDKAALLSKFVRKRQDLLARFRNLQRRHHHAKTKRHALALPVSTRWYSNVMCSKGVVHNRSLLDLVFGDSGLLARVAGQKLLGALHVLHDETFWSNAAFVIELIDPMIKTIAMFERDACCLSVIYQQFQILCTSNIYLSVRPGLDSLIQSKIRDCVKDRWDF